MKILRKYQVLSLLNDLNAACESLRSMKDAGIHTVAQWRVENARKTLLEALVDDLPADTVKHAELETPEHRAQVVAEVKAANAPATDPVPMRLVEKIEADIPDRIA